MRRHLGHGLLLATLLVVTACGSDDGSPTASSVSSSTGDTTLDSTGGTTGGDGSGVTAPETSGTGGSISTTVAGSISTTVAGSTDTTVEGSTVTTARPPATAPVTIDPTQSTNAVPQTASDLVLRSDGLGPLRFGTDVDAVIAAITTLLDTPFSDAPTEYPLAGASGTFMSDDQELGFIKMFGRTVCWSNGMCIESAGDTPGPYTFVGWYYAAVDNNTSLATADGLKVGSTWADFTNVMTAEPGGCYSVGYGSSANISLTLQSSGTPFSSFDDAGTETTALPDPADVVVVQMQAGDQVIFLVGDC